MSSFSNTSFPVMGYTPLTSLPSASQSQVIGNRLTKASIPLNAMQADIATFSSKINAYSAVSASLQSFLDVLNDLEDGTQVGGLSATSSSATVGVSMRGRGVAGTYAVNISQLATAQINNSAVVQSVLPGSRTAAANMGNGSVGIQVGNGPTVNVAITSLMSLNDIAAAINNAKAGVSANVIASGNQFTVQVTGNNTGVPNAVTYTDNGTLLRFGSNVVQTAVNALYTVNGASFQSASNTAATNGIPGVTLNFSSLPASATVTVGASSTAVQNATQSFVSAYNAAIIAINTASSDPASQATQPLLRVLKKQLSRLIANPIASATGTFKSLADVGLTVNSDGTYSVSASTLAGAADSNAASIVSLLAGDSSGNTGLSASLQKAVSSFGSQVTGVFDRADAGIARAQARTGRRAVSAQRNVDVATATVAREYSALQTALSRYSLQSMMVQSLPSASGGSYFGPTNTTNNSSSS